LIQFFALLRSILVCFLLTLLLIYCCVFSFLSKLFAKVRSSVFVEGVPYGDSRTWFQIVYFSIVTKLRDINSICCKISNPHSYITPNPPNSNSQNINNSSPPTPSNSSHSKVPTATQPVESSPSKPADPQPHSTIHTDYTSSPSPSEVVVFAAYPTALHAVGGKRVGTPGRGLGIARARLCRRRLRRGCRGGIGVR
jgi:hypothetical protein